jgi:hypothetical protein
MSLNSGTFFWQLGIHSPAIEVEGEIHTAGLSGTKNSGVAHISQSCEISATPF